MTKSEFDDLKRRIGAAWKELASGRHAEAKSQFLSTLAELEKSDDAENSVALVAVCLCGLAEVWYQKGDYHEAETLALRSLAMQAGLSPPNAFRAQALVMLAKIAFLIHGKMTDAERLLKQALEFQIQLAGPADPNVAIYRSELGNLYRAQGRYEEAEELLRNASTYWQQAAAPDPLAQAQAMKHLASFCTTQHRYQEAVSLLQQSITILEKSMGPGHFRLAYALHDMGHLILRCQPEREGEARKHFERALTLLEVTLGPDSADLMGCLDGAKRFAGSGRGNTGRRKNCFGVRWPLPRRFMASTIETGPIAWSTWRISTRSKVSTRGRNFFVGRRSLASKSPWDRTIRKSFWF